MKNNQIAKLTLDFFEEGVDGKYDCSGEEAVGDFIFVDNLILAIDYIANNITPKIIDCLIEDEIFEKEEREELLGNLRKIFIEKIEERKDY